MYKFPLIFINNMNYCFNLLCNSSFSIHVSSPFLCGVFFMRSWLVMFFPQSPSSHFLKGKIYTPDLGRGIRYMFKIQFSLHISWFFNNDKQQFRFGQEFSKSFGFYHFYNTIHLEYQVYLREQMKTLGIGTKKLGL